MKQAKRRAPNAVRQLLRRIGTAFAEYAAAQRRVTELSHSADRYVLRPAKAPDTYAEFLFLTSGPLRHEPPARKRVASS
ncbi:MAG TPA: hypothetical protein VGI66_07965 [Streptosporangiaceae bacterium]|jgi:hypothetical protein